MVIISESMHFKGEHFYPYLFIIYIFIYLKKKMCVYLFLLFVIILFLLFTVTIYLFWACYYLYSIGPWPICFIGLGFVF